MTPKDIQQLFRSYQAEVTSAPLSGSLPRPSDDRASQFDEALGLPSGAWRFDAKEVTAVQYQHPGESIVNLATPYELCRGLIQMLKPSATDHLLDLGCGDGRVVLYGALVSEATFSGVELVQERADNGRRAIERLALERASITCGNALTHDFSQANMFYAFRPFSVETEQAVLARLHEEGAKRPITIVLHRIQPSVIDTRVFKRVIIGALNVFRSTAR